MEPRLTYTGKVLESGEIKVHRAKEMRQLIAYNFAGKDIEITIQRKRRRRTVQQNSYLHLLFMMFTFALNDLGNKFHPEEIKEMLKYKFLKVDIYNEDTGEKIGERIKGTSELNTIETNVLIDEIIQYGAEMFGFQLPYPNEQINISFNM